MANASYIDIRALPPTGAVWKATKLTGSGFWCNRDAAYPLHLDPGDIARARRQQNATM